MIEFSFCAHYFSSLIGSSPLSAEFFSSDRNFHVTPFQSLHSRTVVQRIGTRTRAAAASAGARRLRGSVHAQESGLPELQLHAPADACARQRRLGDQPDLARTLSAHGTSARVLQDVIRFRNRFVHRPLAGRLAFTAERHLAVDFPFSSITPSLGFVGEALVFFAAWIPRRDEKQSSITLLLRR